MWMKREDISVLAQLLTAMKDSLEGIEKARKDKDGERLAGAKREILSFQRKVSKIL